MVDRRADRVTLVSAVLLGLLERRETLEKTVPLVLLVLRVLRVWPVSVVLWVCPDSAVREVSLVCPDLLESLASKEVLVAAETVDPLGLSDHPVSPDLRESLAERETLDLMVLLEETVRLESRVIAVTLDPLVLPVLRVLPALTVQSDRPANRETGEKLVHKDLLDPQDPLEPEACLDPKDPVVIRARLARVEREVRRATEVSLVSRVCLDLRVKPETRVPLDLLGLLEQEEHPDPLDPQERMEPTVCQDLSDPLDPVVVVERTVLLVPQETLDHLVPLDLPVLASTCLPLLVSVRPTRVLIL